jgi:hypothetical protein
MAASFWLDSTVSVILLPSGDQGDELIALIARWTTLGILGPALWVRPEAVDKSGGGPPKIDATILGETQQREQKTLRVDLFEVLAREPLRKVRLLKVRSAAPSREIDALQDEIADLVTKYLGYSMPMVNPDENVFEQHTQLSRITLICAPTEFQLSERVEWAQDDAGTILIASPEDRSSPWSGDAFVRENDRFAGFVLMHIATAGGVWNGLPKGTLDLFHREASGHQSVWVSRVFVNMVMTNGLARRVAAGVLDDTASVGSGAIDPGSGTPPVGTVLISDARIDQYVDSLVTGAFEIDDAKLDYNKPSRAGDPAQARVGFFKQIGLFARFSVGRVIQIPQWAFRWFRRSANDRLNEKLQGKDGRMIVGADLSDQLDLRDRLLMSRLSNVQASEASARALAVSSVSASSIRSTPKLWSRLREMVFGSLDGSSDLSGIGFTPIEGSVPVFARVNDVLPSPENVWQFSGKTRPTGVPASLRPADVEQVDAMRETIATWVAAANSDVQDRQERLTVVQTANAALTTRLDELTEQLAALDEVEYDANGDARLSRPKRSEYAAATTTKAPPASKARTSNAKTAASIAPAAVAKPTESAAAGKAAAEPVATEPETAQAPPVDPPTSTPVGAAVASDTPKAPQKEASADELRQDFASVKAQLKSGERQAAAITKELDIAGRTLRERTAILTGLDAWIASNDRTFLWRVSRRMTAAKNASHADLDRLEAEVDSQEVPAGGELIRLRKEFHKGVLISWLIEILLVAVVILVPIIFPAILTIAPWYPATTVLVLSGLGVLIVTLIGILARYYLGWSHFEREVEVVLWRLEGIAEDVQHSRQEFQRLESLHGQAREWMDLLSIAIHDPWEVNPHWLDDDAELLGRDALPFAMQVAQIDAKDLAAAVRLKRLTSEALLVKGWRAAAFERLLGEIRDRLGLDSSRFGVDALDGDLPHASNNSRRILRDHVSDPDILEAVARFELHNLIENVQSSSLNGARPSVSRQVADPLDAISSDIEGIENGSGQLTWDEFLLGSLVGEGRHVTPLSGLSVAPYELQRGYHQQVESYLLVPERLAPSLVFAEDSKMSAVPYGDEIARPLELVLRVDIAGPLPADAVRLWDRGHLAESVAVAASAEAKTVADDSIDSGV